LTRSNAGWVVSGRLIDVAAGEILTAASVTCTDLEDLLAKAPRLAPTLLGIEEPAPGSAEIPASTRDDRALRIFAYNTLYYHDSVRHGVPPEGACRVNLYGVFPSGRRKASESDASLKLDGGAEIPGPFSARVLFIRPGNRWLKLLGAGGGRLDFAAPAGGCVNVLVSPITGHFIAAECTQRYHVLSP
jgi:hypothetical protein